MRMHITIQLYKCSLSGGNKIGKYRKTLLNNSTTNVESSNLDIKNQLVQKLEGGVASALISTSKENGRLIENEEEKLAPTLTTFIYLTFLRYTVNPFGHDLKSQ